MILQRVFHNGHLFKVLLSSPEFSVSCSKVQPAAEHMLCLQPQTGLADAARKDLAAVLPQSGRRRHRRSAWPKPLGCWLARFWKL